MNWDVWGMPLFTLAVLAVVFGLAALFWWWINR